MTFLNFVNQLQRCAEDRRQCRAFWVVNQTVALAMWSDGGHLLNVVKVVDEAQSPLTILRASTPYYWFTVNVSGS
jgi:hypothetical protein